MKTSHRRIVYCITCCSFTIILQVEVTGTECDFSQMDCYYIKNNSSLRTALELQETSRTSSGNGVDNLEDFFLVCFQLIWNQINLFHTLENYLVY